MDLTCSFLVVTRGNPCSRSKRIWWPKTESVPVPVRSRFSRPCLSTCSISSWYWRINEQPVDSAPSVVGNQPIHPVLHLFTPSPYIKAVRVRPDYGDKRLRNKRTGPGGGTRRLHQMLILVLVGWASVGA